MQYRVLSNNTVRVYTELKTYRLTRLKTSALDADVLLTMHLSTTLVNDQPDAQFFYFIIRLLQSSTFFEQRHAHHEEVKLY